MITSTLNNADLTTAKCVTHILSRIDYVRLSRMLARAKENTHRDHTTALLEYTHSTVHDTIAEMERIPGTSVFIHDFLERPDIQRMLQTLFATCPAMMIVYTRRKLDADGTPTKTRQLVLRISTELLSPILNHELSILTPNSLL